LNVAADSKL